MTAPTPTLVAPEVPRIEALALGELLSASSTSSRPPLIVDVRDPGTAGGFIRGALSIPKVKFEDDAFVEQFVNDHRDEEMIVFHCLNSNGRGPYCAGRVNALVSGNITPEIRILKGGFRVFSETFGMDSVLVDSSDLPSEN